MSLGFKSLMWNSPDKASIPSTCTDNLIPKFYILQRTAISILSTSWFLSFFFTLISHDITDGLT